ncbi:hypothetical protein GCM10007978_35080 [Shewanella hanedai]|uniref:hypothetical protein n=1 Tax=Shewanella hanedai TaxID=25 RepID=UPI00163DA0F0|nr:hypothetical protein [Shewanella hanedai]GGI94418.1 hypothetical protein GCM10007978_35080 [Shewanella hanedai]
MSSFYAEVGSQKPSLQASFSTSDTVLTSLNVEQLCSSLVARHMDVVNVINAGAINDLASEALNSR